MDYSMYHRMKKESEKLCRTTRERVVHFDITTKTAKESGKWSQKINREKIKGSNVTRLDSFGLNWDSLIDEDIEANLFNTSIRGPYNYQPNIPFWRQMEIEKGSIRTEFDLCSRNSSIHEPPSYIEDSESEASTYVSNV
uniref:Uncharacterized protein n=1 Tax=Acrobeloides nanus TaxID=290746 RepID=A0A914EMJ5_9BILA